MKKLVQRGLLYKDSYEIVEDGILVKRNSIESRHAYKLLFEDMGFHIQQDKKRNELVFILAGLVFMLFQGKIVHGYYREGLTPTEVFLWTSVHMGLLLFILAIGYLGKRNLLFLSGGSKSLVLKNSNRSELQAFIKEIRLAAKKYYLESNGFAESDLPDQPHIVHWLYRKGILDYQEFQSIRGSANIRSIGF